jgi:D-alanyl-D-alanine carboxypeptidase (penicillin-binding protein 5/6)
VTARRIFLRLAPFLLVLIGLSLIAQECDAARRRPARSRSARARAVRPPAGPTYQSALVIDVESGRVLYQKDPHAPRAPASLAKMMLELLALEAIRAGDLSLYDTAVVPAEVKKVRGSRVRLRVGETVTVRDLLEATAIASANDAATALAIKLAGSTEACVARMNRRARELEMLETVYHNVHGLDRSDEPGNITTAWDLSILGRQLISMPEALELSSTVQTTIRGGKQTIHTTNRLLTQCRGVDGLKTGYTGRAGYCLVSTAEREDMRILSVCLGARSNRRRFSESGELIERAFAQWERVRVVAKGQDLGEDLEVREGRGDSVRLVAGSDIDLLVQSRRKPEIRLAVSAPTSTRAPIAAGWTLGSFQVMLGDSVAAEGPAVAREKVSRASAFHGLQELLNR